MTDKQRIELVEKDLAEALARIQQLEGKVETMRVSINSNLNGHTDILYALAKFTDCPTPMHFTHVDVAMG